MGRGLFQALAEGIQSPQAHCAAGTIILILLIRALGHGRVTNLKWPSQHVDPGSSNALKSTRPHRPKHSSGTTETRRGLCRRAASFPLGLTASFSTTPPDP